jgi:hypothetical protein
LEGGGRGEERRWRNACNDISPEFIIRRFKESYKSHKMNGTNDYVLWEEKYEENSSSSDGSVSSD